MRRRAFIGGFVGAAIAPVLGARPARAAPPLVAVLSPLDPDTAARNLAAFRAGLAEQGLAEGRDLMIAYHFAEGSRDRLTALAGELVAARPAAIVVGSPAGILAVAEATRSVPVVFIGVTDPIALGVVHSLARPGTNVTGLTIVEGSPMWAKRLGLVKELLPALSRVSALVSAAMPDDLAAAIPELRDIAGRLDVALQVEALRDADALEAAFAAMARSGAQALLISHALMFNVNRVLVADLAARVRLPATYGFAEFVQVGGLMAYAPSLPAQYHRAASFVARILRGAKPGDLAIEEPTQFELTLNLKTAKALGLAIPPAFLARADAVIE